MKAREEKKETLVSIVGAGPGDPKLLTIKAKECLQAADAIFYDALVNPIILSYCREGIERIAVGKRAGRHSHEQGDINSILVERALKGGRIVRLKGGDPFIFGRGGEEIQALNEHNIPFEVIPGLSAGITVPAYAGIPMTHRGISRSVTFITATTKNPDEQLPWEALAGLNGSIAFYMGCRVVPNICKNLIAAGMSPDTPAAIISNGTLPNQSRIIATLAKFTPDYTDYPSWSPGLFVVGEVVNFSKEFDFFFTTGVSQRKVLCVTMDRERSNLAALIDGKVAYTHTMNMVDRIPLDDDSSIDVEHIINAPNLLFITPSAVDATIQLLNKNGLDIRAMKGNIFSGGHTTSKKLLSYGLLSNKIFSQSNIPNAGKDISPEITILCADDESALSWKKSLNAEGWIPSELILYRESPKHYTEDDINFLKAIQFTHIVFSSTRAIEQFGKLIKKYQLEEMLENAKLMTYGATTYNTLKALGYDSITAPEGSFWRNPDIANIILS